MSKASGRWRPLLNVVGGLLSLVGVVYVVFRLRHYWAGIDVGTLRASVWWLSAVLVPVGVGMNALLALAWRQILLQLGTPVQKSSAFALYGRSQLARYVPGNIFHFASRQAMGMSAGLPAGVLARSVPFELGLVSVAAVLCMPLVLPVVVTGASGFLSLLLAVVAMAGGLALAHRLAGSATARALALQLAYMIVSGVMFLGVLLASSPDLSLAPDACMAVVGAFIAAWLAGLVTPGAPAGMGVRELVLIFLLGTMTGQPALLLCLVLTRVIGIVADSLTYVLAAVMRTTRSSRAIRTVP